MKFGDVVISVVILVVVFLIIIPLSPAILDVLIIINIAASLVIILTTLYTKEPLEFSVFPPLLLIVTLYRIALNISSTKLILGNGGDAGEVIRTFGNFVIGGNLVVGVIVFIIIIIVQFLVITKGAERVAEVAARFTLDAMPGKQMAIDADLNSGIIDEQQAKARRIKVQRESDFYSAMDGASKFVKGDSIVGIIIAVVNIVGGIIIGMTGSNPGTISDVVQTYTLATVGDGLVSQIPALLISTATGLIVTRAASDGSFSQDLRKQFSSQPTVLMITGSMLLLVAFIPGMPKPLMFPLGGVFIWLGYSMNKSKVKLTQAVETENAEKVSQDIRKPENVISLLQVDPIELEFGYGIIPLADANRGGDLLDRVVMIRKQCAIDLGMIVPVIRLRDNLQLNTNKYIIKIKGNEVASGEVYADQYLAMNPGNAKGTVNGIETIEPAFGLPAVWVTEKERDKAELLGYTIIDPPSVIATHLTEVLKMYGHELLGRQQVQNLIDNLRQTQPALVDEVVPKIFGLGEVQKVLSNLLKENVSIRDMSTIIETLADFGTTTRDLAMLTEYVRQNLKRTITKKFIPDRKARVITLDPSLEQLIMEKVRQTDTGSFVALDPDTVQKIFLSMKSAVERLTSIGITPIVLTSPMVRMHFKKLIEQMVPDLIVLSYNEIEQNVEIYSEGVVTVN